MAKSFWFEIKHTFFAFITYGVLDKSTFDKKDLKHIDVMTNLNYKLINKSDLTV